MTGPGGEIDPQEDLPTMCRATRSHTRRRLRCVLCGQLLLRDTLVIINRRQTVYRHAACVARARDRQRAVAQAPSDRRWMPAVVVTGGRDFADYAFLAATLDSVPLGSLAHGGALGADFLAGRWALHNSVPVTVYEADWGVLGLRAGPARNEAMLDGFRPALVVAFAGGRGTAHCVRAARQRKIPVWDTTEHPSLAAALTAPSPTGLASVT